MSWKVYAGIGVLVFAADEILKQGVEEQLFPGEERQLPGERILLRKVYNEGAALGCFRDSPELLTRISAGICSASLLYDCFLLQKKGKPVKKLGMILFTAGAASNTFDRLLRGRVIDYIGFRMKNPKLTRITYNIGDFAIFQGLLLAAASSVFPER